MHGRVNFNSILIIDRNNRIVHWPLQEIFRAQINTFEKNHVESWIHESIMSWEQIIQSVNWSITETPVHELINSLWIFINHTKIISRSSTFDSGVNIPASNNYIFKLSADNYVFDGDLSWQWEIFRFLSSLFEVFVQEAAKFFQLQVNCDGETKVLSTTFKGYAVRPKCPQPAKARQGSFTTSNIVSYSDFSDFPRVSMFSWQVCRDFLFSPDLFGNDVAWFHPQL